jgi:hypothetical protein
MAISSVTNRVTYQGNGTTAVFAFGYELHSPSDLAVFAYNSSLSENHISALSLNGSGGFGFTFSGTYDSAGVYPSGGTIICNSAPNAQTVMVLFRSSAVTADFAVSKFQAIPGDGLTNAIDRLTMVAQRAQDIGTRSVRLKDGFSGEFDPTLPEGVKKSPGYRLIINSTATGFALEVVANSSIPVNVMSVSLGGTGTGTVLNDGNIVFAGPTGAYTQNNAINFNSATGTLVVGSSQAQALLQLAAGFGSAPLRTSATGIMANGSTSLTSEVSGVLPVSSGGTNATSLNPQGVLFASSATQVGVVPSAPVGYALLSQGSSAPVFGPIVTTNTIVVSSSATTHTNATNQVQLYGTSHTDQLFDCNGNEGRKILFHFTGTSLLNVYTIVASGAQRIGRYGNSVKMHTLDQLLELTVVNSSLWAVTMSKTETSWAATSQIRFDAVGSPPSPANSAVTNHYTWRRRGSQMQALWRYRHTSNGGAAAGSGVYLYHIENSSVVAKINTQLHPIATDTTNAGPLAVGGNTGNALFGTNGNALAMGIPVVYNSTAFFIRWNSDASENNITSALYNLNGAVHGFAINAEFTIDEWID